jgi:hypothetical protein
MTEQERTKLHAILYDLATGIFNLQTDTDRNPDLRGDDRMYYERCLDNINEQIKDL